MIEQGGKFLHLYYCVLPFMFSGNHFMILGIFSSDGRVTPGKLLLQMEDMGYRRF